MGTDLATVLATFAVLANGDIDTQSFYLGAGKNGVGGLNRHSTVEADVSPSREDYYNGCGDNHHLSSRLVKQLVKYADQDAKKEFSLDTMGKSYAESAGFAKNNNPTFITSPSPRSSLWAHSPFTLSSSQMVLMVLAALPTLSPF